MQATFDDSKQGSSVSDSRTIYEVFQDVARKRPLHPAVVYLGTTYDYGRIERMAGAFAAALADLGVTAGQKVMLYIPNSVQWVVAWLGIQRLGGICVPVTPIYTPHDIAYIANDSGVEAVVCADTNFGYVQKVLAETAIQQVIVTRMADLLPAWKRGFGYLFDIIPRGRIALDPNTHVMRRMIAGRSTKSNGNASRVESPAKSASGIAEILYTGGTTKFPKGVPIGHELFLASADEQIRICEPLFPAADNVVLGNAPLFHILGQTCGLAALLVGATLILQPRINMDATFETIQRFKAKTMIGVPTLYRMMLEHDRLDQYDLSSVQYWFSAGDVLPVEVGKRWYERFGHRIYQGYGATETCGGVAMCPLDYDNPPKSVGRIVGTKSIKIVDPAFLTPVAPGEPGELIVSSDHMVDHYLNKPDETEQAFIEQDGRKWYRTADIMSQDAAGNLYFVDRTVDTIKHKGYRVSASEIEAVLQEHPAVIASCVIGVPDKKVGERIKGYVVLKEDIKGITGYDLIKWCRKTLVSYKVPQYIEFRDMLPKSKVGKLLRREIRSEEDRRAEA